MADENVLRLKTEALMGSLEQLGRKCKTMAELTGLILIVLAKAIEAATVH